MGKGRLFMRGRNLLVYWAPPLLWMGVIFYFSTDRFSSDQTGSVLLRLIGWFWPGMPEEGLAGAHFLLRKLGHLTEYAILAWLWMRALPAGGPRAWCVCLIVAGFASVDEWHQSLTLHRTGSPWDVLIDVTGGLIGMALWNLHARRRQG